MFPDAGFGIANAELQLVTCGGTGKILRGSKYLVLLAVDSL
jgi:hypothetical protein